MQSYVHDFLTTISNEKTFLQDCLVILNRPLQNYSKILIKFFLCATWTVMLSESQNIQPLINSLPVAKGLKFNYTIVCYSQRNNKDLVYHDLPW